MIQLGDRCRFRAHSESPLDGDLWRAHQKLPATVKLQRKRIAGEPGCARLVYSLYAGPSLAHRPVTYVLERAPASSFFENFLDFDIPVDIARIEGVLSFNVFQPADCPHPQAEKESDLPSALFVLPPLLNHSCNLNAA